jgi:predicted type IV restriction endonuclease
MVVDIRKPLKKFLPHLLKAREDNLNEADTVQRIIKVFEEVLGYDPLGEITRECQIRDKYVDIALKIDGNIRLLVEVKAAGVELRDRHIEQAEHYAAVGNIAWVVLTNGVVWTLYHLSFDEGVEYVRAFSVDLASDCTDEAAELLAILHRQSLTKGSIDEYWQHKAALRPESIGKAIFSEDTMKLIRREIRRHENILIDEEDLARAIHEMFSTETRELLGPPKIKRKSKARVRARVESSVTTSVDPLCQAHPSADIAAKGCATSEPLPPPGESEHV